MSNTVEEKHQTMAKPDSLDPLAFKKPCWKTLGDNPGVSSVPETLGFGKRLQVQAAAGGDIFLRSCIAALLAMTAFPFTFDPKQLKKDIEQGQFYRDLADEHNPQAVFANPPHIDVEESVAPRRHSAPRDALCTTLSFDSPYELVNPDADIDYLSRKKNLRARAQYWRHHKHESRPTICVIHGYLMSSYRMNSAFFKLRNLFDQGYDILLYTLPHHGDRQEQCSQYSGHGYFSRGLSWVNESMAHAVFDFRIFLNYLERRGAKFGVTGLSLGGYTPSLLAGVESRLQFVIPNAPAISFADIFMLWNPTKYVFNRGLKKSGTSLHEVRHTLAMHSPLNYRPVIAKERLRIIAGLGDRFVLPEQVNLLWHHWQKPDIHWFPGNHAMHFGKQRYMAELEQFFHDIGFSEA